MNTANVQALKAILWDYFPPGLLTANQIQQTAEYLAATGVLAPLALTNDEIAYVVATVDGLPLGISVRGGTFRKRLAEIAKGEASTAGLSRSRDEKTP